MLSIVESAMSGRYHVINPRYVRRYLDEVAYRFNCRLHLSALLRRLARAMTMHKPWHDPKSHVVDDFRG